MPIEARIFVAGLIVLLGFFAFRYFKYGSMRGAMYKSRVLRTVGEVELKSFGGVATTLRILVLEDRRIIVEKSTRSLLSYAHEGFPMSPDDADQLIGLLQQAKT